MRRVFVVLVAALALTFLVPASAMGGRPVFEVTGITVTSTGAHGTDYAGEAVCGWTATVEYSATGRRAAEVDIESHDMDKLDMAHLACPLQGDGDTTFGEVEQVMYGDAWRWQAYIVGHNGFRAISPIEFTSTHTFTRYACPATGTVIAAYP